MKREECLDKAKENVTGHREQDYGKIENNFAVIADYWNTYLRGKWGDKVTFAIYPRDVAHMMALFKWARITTGTATDDSYVDAAGYTACAAELAGGELKTVRAVSDGKGNFTYTDEGGL